MIVDPQEIRKFIVESFLFGDGGGLSSDDDSFLELGIIDSTGILELMGFLEFKYAIKLRDEDVTPENFDSINKLAAFVERKMGAMAPGLLPHPGDSLAG